jgi:hypothetical protein
MALRSAFSPTSTFSSLEGDADGGVLRKEFIPNWASDKFAEFVEKIGGGLWICCGKG